MAAYRSFLKTVLVFVLPALVVAVTTTHYDKSPAAKLAKTRQKEQSLNITLPAAERHKRLLPYMNFYLVHQFNQPVSNPGYENPASYQVIAPKQNQYQAVKFVEPQQINYVNSYQPKLIESQQILYQPNTKYTPFLESNALPGPFIPMISNQPQHAPLQYQSNKLPNYGAIYEKLSQLKLAQQNLQHPQYHRVTTPQIVFQNYVGKRPQQTNYIPAQDYQNPGQIVQLLKPIEQTKTIVETYTPTNIDILPTGPHYEQNFAQTPVNHYQNYQIPENQKYIQQVIEEHPLAVTHHPIIVEEKQPRTRPTVIIRKPYRTQRPKITQYLKETTHIRKPIIQPTYQEEPHYHYEPLKYEAVSEYQPKITTEKAFLTTENANSLNLLLRKLQDSNTLPQTLTSENIDNSIKTLVRILNALKKQQKQSRPIIVADEGDYVEDDVDNENGLGGSVTEDFPANTPEGGTPGKAGVDYPALSTIPPTNFNCKTQRYKGFFADPDTNCQVWHYCDLNGGQASFLCPNGTIFSQVALTCDWWYNVKCSTTTQLYVLNERLYKYIIPLTPKFPEDYSGPLVDRYLATKFKEMEEKMKQEEADKKEEEKKEEDELQLLEKSSTEKTKYTTSSEETD